MYKLLITMSVLLFCFSLLIAGCTLFTAPKSHANPIPESTDDSAFWLGDASPNPMPVGGTTTFSFGTKDGSETRLIITNVLEQEIWSTVPSSSGSIHWNGRDNRGRTCPSGVYFNQLITPNIESRNKILLIN